MTVEITVTKIRIATVSTQSYISNTYKGHEMGLTHINPIYELILNLLILDDCLWGPWQKGAVCDCNTWTKTETRPILRNATGQGLLCTGKSQRVETCLCGMNSIHTSFPDFP